VPALGLGEPHVVHRTRGDVRADVDEQVLARDRNRQGGYPGVAIRCATRRAVPRWRWPAAPPARRTAAPRRRRGRRRWPRCSRTRRAPTPVRCPIRSPWLGLRATAANQALRKAGDRVVAA
jgi:hypothetical protein